MTEKESKKRALKMLEGIIQKIKDDKNFILKDQMIAIITLFDKLKIPSLKNYSRNLSVLKENVRTRKMHMSEHNIDELHKLIRKELVC